MGCYNISTLLQPNAECTLYTISRLFSKRRPNVTSQNTPLYSTTSLFYIAPPPPPYSYYASLFPLPSRALDNIRSISPVFRALLRATSANYWLDVARSFRISALSFPPPHSSCACASAFPLSFSSVGQFILLFPRSFACCYVCQLPARCCSMFRFLRFLPLLLLPLLFFEDL